MLTLMNTYIMEHLHLLVPYYPSLFPDMNVQHYCSGGGEGHFNFICTGMCGHRIGKLTHPQTKAGPSINKNRPILRLFTVETDWTAIGFIQFREKPPIPRLNYIKFMTHPHVFVKNLHLSADIQPGKLTHSGRTSLIWPNMGVPPGTGLLW